MATTYTLTPALAAEYAKVFDFRSAIVKAGRQVLAAYGIDAVGLGDGVQKLPRYMTALDFERGAATGRMSPVILGDRRQYEYSEFTGTFTIMNSVPITDEERSADAYLSEDHQRELDRLTSLEDAIFMQHVGAFSPSLLPMHEVTKIVPMAPDERPVEMREVNAAYRRWQLTVNIRADAWPSSEI